MQINVIDVGNMGVNGFDYLIYPEQNPSTLQYLHNQLNNFSSGITDIGRQFLEQTKIAYNSINNSDVVRAAKAALRTAKGFFHPNTIRPLYNIDELQSASPVMQRWIMAEPTIRTMYHENKCDGFYDTYVDNQPTKIGNDHYDYRRVMDSIIVDTDDGWSVTNYAEDLLDGDKELDFQDKAYILSTWDLMKMMLDAHDEDFTNPVGGTLGV
jgi:hypothetical protein